MIPIKSLVAKMPQESLPGGSSHAEVPLSCCVKQMMFIFPSLFLRKTVAKLAAHSGTWNLCPELTALFHWCTGLNFDVQNLIAGHLWGAVNKAELQWIKQLTRVWLWFQVDSGLMLNPWGLIHCSYYSYCNLCALTHCSILSCYIWYLN